MKKFLLALSVFALSASAQSTDNELDLKIEINRHPCIQMPENADGATSVRQMHKTSLKHSNALLNAKGTPKIVVALVNFEDKKFTTKTTDAELVEQFDKFFNGKNVSGQIGHNPRSVSEYFDITSKGQFTPEFTVLNPVTVKAVSTYANKAATFMKDALDAIDAQMKNRTADFDNNKGVKDGVVDGIVIVFAGEGSNTNSADKTNVLWPCTWSSSIYASAGGIKYAAPLICPEIIGKTYLNGIGVYVHEMSHAMGLPDFYDTNSTYVAPGMDYWSLMDAGEYTNNGFDPTPYTAYEKAYFGWIELEELNSAATIENMKTLHEGDKAYIIYNDGNKGEYYILENRTFGDPLNSKLCKLFEEGLMIYHVDENASAWSNNTVNRDINHQMMTIVPANGHFEMKDNIEYDSNGRTQKYLNEMKGHLWPLNTAYTTDFGLTTGNNQLTDEERKADNRIAPAATLYNANTDGKKLMHKPITEITKNADKSISFKFMGGSTTGIEEVEVGESGSNASLSSRGSKGSIYNLAGQKVNNNYKGFVIKNGRKYIK